MTEEENRNALAQVIDPESWALYDNKDVIKTMRPELREKIVEDSLKVAQRVINSGLMASFEWDRAEYVRARARIIENTSRVGYCESVPDSMDGYFRHDPKCPNWPDGAIGGSSCISNRNR